jgi:hypothetical protein
VSNPNTAALWPQPIEIIGVTGEYASGKTLFMLSISPGKRTKVYDTEKSSGAYSALGFDRVSIPDVMVKQKPTGYKPIDTFTWWWGDVKDTPPGKYDVIGIDTISEIEEGLVEWVSKNPTYFGHSSGQYAKMSGVMWGDVKNLWKAILNDLASRCQTFVFCSHMANVWQGDRPTGKRKPKGKETLMELASLYLLMERKADDKGRMPTKPAATVLKSRLVHARFDPASGDLDMVPCLPPRLPEATPAAIRKYMENPPDYSKLKKDELVREDKMTSEERELIALQKAEAERDAERMRLERMEQQKQMLAEQKAGQQDAARAAAQAQKQETAAGFHKPQLPAMPGDEGEAPAAPAEAPAATPANPPPAGPDAVQLQRLLHLKQSLESAGMTADEWKAALGEYGVTKGRELTPAQADELIGKLSARLQGAA